MKSKYSEIVDSPFNIVAHSTAFPIEKGGFYTNEQISNLNFPEEDLKDTIMKVEALGFKNRYRANADTTSVDLMTAALNKAMSDTILPDEIDLLITVTTTSPRYTTSTSAMVADSCKLECPCFEMKTGCASPIYAIHIAAKLLSRSTKTIALVFGETLTKTVPLNHKGTYAVGDGGAALILQYEEDTDKGIIWSGIGSDSKHYSKMGVPGILPPKQEDLDTGKYFMHFDSAINPFLEARWKELASIIHQKVNMKEVDRVLMNQANQRMVHLFSESLHTTNIENVVSKYGNCGPVSIVSALSNYLTEHPKQNANLILAAVGGGISYGIIHLKV